MNSDTLWKTELQRLSSLSATRSWLIAAVFAPMYCLFELNSTPEYFKQVAIFTATVSAFLVLIVILKRWFEFPKFITDYAVSIIISACASALCVTTSGENVHYYLLVVSIISMSKGILYYIDPRNLAILSLFNHFVAYSAIIIVRDESLFEITEIYSTILYQGILLLFSFSGAKMRYNLTKDNYFKNIEIEKGKALSDSLLLNILPEKIADELKIHGKAQAQEFESADILFTDFKGFTEASAKLNAAELVSEINTCFIVFDNIMGKYGIEKIKTIGDAYMAASGLPVQSDDSAKNAVLAALEMQEFISKRKAEMDAAGKPAFEMRVGIHTGPVVAGIVGVKKFQYDIWGDAVNTAARMESSGEVEKVNISEATYNYLKDDPDLFFESRGKIEAKGKGDIEMYFVSKA
jgi:class 3 adenylate cyclase